MREEDLILARAIVAQQQDASPGASPAPLRRTLVTNLQDKTKQFRPYQGADLSIDRYGNKVGEAIYGLIDRYLSDAASARNRK
ncbi:NAD kinase-like isoform X1 [Anopheles sinensis]|uniref:NAD kinase-like isoform X1 n=1 Tax=Anopheles sinensis TaxID=74873 RepID=A0A084WM78_ANOSI|nr:NAD kinase-like isoform X1 [Anopheles sinensis]